jgi:hypothetical protein
LVEVVLAQDPAQSGLGELARRREIIADLDDGALGIDDAEIDDGGDGGIEIFTLSPNSSTKPLYPTV